MLTLIAILFLCSKEAKWITGLIMPVDGGVSRLGRCSQRDLQEETNKLLILDNRWKGCG